MQGKPFEFSALVKNFRMPAKCSRRCFGITQHSTDINRLAEILAKIFAESLHAGIQGISKTKYSPAESFSTAARISAKCFSNVGRWFVHSSRIAMRRLERFCC